MSWRPYLWAAGGVFVAATMFGRVHAGANKNTRPDASAAATRWERREVAAVRSEPVATVVEAQVASAFTSPADCERLVSLGHRAPRAKETARVATWNVRWFPDGVAEDDADSPLATNVPWLACAIAWLNVDVIALEEVKAKPQSVEAMQRLASRLTELTRETYSFRIDDCPDSSGQHLAWLWNEKRVKTSGFRLHSAINPYQESCASQLRPGFGVNLVFAGGLDLHAVAVHFKSGKSSDDFAKRRQSMKGVGEVTASVVHDSGDKDVLVLGDLNTMGCDTCAWARRGAAEVLEMDSAMAGFHVPMRRAPPDLGCSHYYQRQPSLLDHALITTSSEEVSVGTKVEVHGFCRDLSCESFTGSGPSAMTELSDHCPIVLSLLDKDLDRD